jgi:outer membrane lipoprotein SlyB
MKTKLTILIFSMAASSFVLTGCVDPNGNPDNTGTGALTGGAVGAFSGAVIDGRNPGAGALIGAAIGAITGGLIGHSMDQEQQERLREQAPQTYVRVDQGQPLGMTDVKALAKAGVSDDVIISQIKNSHTIFRLSAADIIDLHGAGVSDAVVNFMINTQSSVDAAPATTSTMVVETAPPPAPVETVTVVAPGPGYMWVDGEWVWNGQWIWVAGHWGYPPYAHAVWIRGDWARGPHGWYRAPGHWR